jgi:hypothetical protein
MRRARTTAQGVTVTATASPTTLRFAAWGLLRPARRRGLNELLQPFTLPLGGDL